jgi:iron complex outermembrane receptor protein
LIIFAIGPLSHAQEGLLLYDAENSQALDGATVRTRDNTSVMVSDSSGFVSLSGLELPASLIVTHVGYNTVHMHLTEPIALKRIYLEPQFTMLDAIIVSGHENDRKLTEIAGSYAVLSRHKLGAFGSESLVRTMNTLPGIRMEERSPASYRVSIRGSLLRAPFGVRNIKVYWNDIPFTEPTGNTPLNMLDVSSLGRVEIIKGPAGSVYGAGMGGVINFESSRPAASGIRAEAAFSAGSYGMRRLEGKVQSGDQRQQWSAGYQRQYGDGYREHTNFERESVQLQGRLFASDQQTISLHMLYSDLFYELPGGLTAEQYADDPRMARPRSVQQNALIDQQIFLAGAGHDYEWRDGSGNSTSLYISNGIKENPFITNYELERLNGFGGRTRFYHTMPVGGQMLKLTAGGEFQVGRFHANNHGNADGFADTLRYEDEMLARQSFVFGQAELDLGDDWLLSTGASLNFLEYTFDRLRDVALDTAYVLNRSFEPVLSPRIGLVKKLNARSAIHASISSGFSPPTTEEVRTSDGQINDELEAERGINYELGYRGNAFNNRFTYDITAFFMQQRQTIVSQTAVGGNATFYNAGRTDQRGFEMLLAYQIIDAPQSFVSSLTLQTSTTYHDFIFSDYQKERGGENVDFSGNQLTGTAPFIASTSLYMETRAGFYININHNYTDEIPLNDDNTVYADAYHLVVAKCGYTLSLSEHFQVELFAGVDNILNQKYSLGNDLNAFGGRYFNPAPERNYFAGLRINVL